MRAFAKGFNQYFLGLGFWIKSPSLLRLSIIPFIINSIFLLAGLYYAISHVSGLVTHIFHPPHLWYQYFLYYALALLTALGLFLIVIFVSVTASNIVAFPFNSLLAGRALKIRGIPREPGKSWFGRAKTNGLAMLRRTLLFTILGLILFVMSFIPGVGILGGAIGAFLMAYDKIDYGFDHLNLTFSERKRFVRLHFWEIAGFSLALGLTSGVPIINILIQPGGIVAGCLLVVGINRREFPLERPDPQASAHSP